jgi:hypothetical protein
MSCVIALRSVARTPGQTLACAPRLVLRPASATLAQPHPSASAQPIQAMRADGQQTPEACHMLVAFEQASRRLRVTASHSTEQRLPKGYRRQIITSALHGCYSLLSLVSIRRHQHQRND